MRKYHRIGLGLLVGLFFASGYAARLYCTAAENKAGISRQAPLLMPGTRVAATNLNAAANVDFRPLETLLYVVNSIRQHYVEEITDSVEGEMTHDALRGMLAQLEDPNTRFLSPAQRKIVESATEGTFHGIGAVLGIKRIKLGDITDEHLIVISPLQSGPADKAGLRPGDDITWINNKSVLPFNPFQKVNALAKTEENRNAWSPELKKKIEAERKRIEGGIPIMEAENKLMSEDKGELLLTVVRKGAAAPIKVKITPRELKIEPVAASVIEDGKLGCIRISCITPQAGEEVATALSRFRDARVEGLVIDLRGAVGGQVQSMLDVAESFAAGKKIATLVRSHGRRSAITAPAGDESKPWNGPITVLVNRGTTRMAEVLAAALKDACGAKLIGETTCGDLNHVTLIEQPDGSCITLTTGVFLTSKGINYNAKGLPVDVKVASTSTGDSHLKEAVKLLTAAGGSKI